MRLKMCLMAGILAGAEAFANVPQVLTYNGVLAKSGGFAKRETLNVTFALYDTAEPNDVALWARQMPVAVDTDGVFSAELRDDMGSNPLPTNRSLVEALVAVKGAAEIGIRPADCAADLQPRQRLEWNARAGRAARAKAADLFEAQRGVTFAGRTRVDELVAKDVTVTGNAIATGKCTFLRRGGRTVGGNSSTITVKGVQPEFDATSPKEYVKGAFTTDRATADMAVTYGGRNGAFSVLVPKGGKIVSSGGGDEEKPQVMSATIFGK